MRSTVWVLDPSRGRAGAEEILAPLASRGIDAQIREVPSGLAVVIDNPPPDLAPPAGVIRTATVEVPGGEAVTRRALLDVFAGALVLTAGAGAAGVAAFFASPPAGRREDVGEIEAASLSDLKKKGAVRFRFGKDPCILVWSGGQIHALSLVCTHLGCLVDWSAERKQLVCPCHRAAFGLSGNVIEGPPPRPLTTYNVSVAGDRVLVKRRTDA